MGGVLWGWIPYDESKDFFLKDWCFEYTAWYLNTFLLHISNSVNLFQKSTIFEFLRGFVDIRSIWFKPFNGNNKYCDTRRQIEHITLNETNDNRPMRYNKRDLYPDVFYGIIVIAKPIMEWLLCLKSFYTCSIMKLWYCRTITQD